MKLELEVQEGRQVGLTHGVIYDPACSGNLRRVYLNESEKRERRERRRERRIGGRKGEESWREEQETYHAMTGTSLPVMSKST